MTSKSITINDEIYYPIEKDNVYVGQELYILSRKINLNNYLMHSYTDWFLVDGTKRIITEVTDFGIRYEKFFHNQFDIKEGYFSTKWCYPTGLMNDRHRMCVKSFPTKSYQPTQIGDLDDDL